MSSSCFKYSTPRSWSLPSTSPQCLRMWNPGEHYSSIQVRLGKNICAGFNSTVTPSGQCASAWASPIVSSAPPGHWKSRCSIFCGSGYKGREEPRGLPNNTAHGCEKLQTPKFKLQRSLKPQASNSGSEKCHGILV